MTTSELAEHLEMIDQATEEDFDEFLEELLETPYESPDQQDN